MTTQDENNRTEEEVKNLVSKFTEEMLKHTEEIEATQEELKNITDQLNSLRKLEAELLVKKRSLDDQLIRNRRNKRITESQKNSAMRELEVAEQKRRLVKEFEEKSKELDALTASAKWREWAFDHQIIGGKRLAVARRGICADKRGLGKTLTSLIYCDMVQANKVLVIAPSDVVDQFEDEIRAWAPARRIFSLAGLNPQSRSLIYPMLRNLGDFVITLNYEAWRRDKTIVDKLVDIGLDTVILDEAHRIKECNKITARGVFQIVHAKNYCPTCKTIGSAHNGGWAQKQGLKDVKPWATPTCDTCGTHLESTVKNVLSMTGTPFLNRPQELFSLLYLVNPRAFPDQKSFLRDYCYSPSPNRWRFLPGGEERLVRKMQEFFVQRNREDAGITVPPPAIIHHELDFDKEKYPEQWRAYRQLNDAAVIILEKGKGTAYEQHSILQVINNSRQMQSWPAGINIRDNNPDSDTYGEILCQFDVEESQKLDAVEELCRELAEEGERFIVWSKFKKPLYELERRLQKDISVTLATGDQTKDYRKEVRQDFDLKTAPEKPRWVGCFATYEAFGTGMNLNAARHAISLDDEWSPGMQDQAIGRIDRMNSMDQATFHIFRVKKTIDTFMAALIEEKKKITGDFESVMITAQDLLNALRSEEM